MGVAEPGFDEFSEDGEGFGAALFGGEEEAGETTAFGDVQEAGCGACGEDAEGGGDVDYE